MSGDEIGHHLGVAAEAARSEHDRLAVVLHHAFVTFRVRAYHRAVPS